ncbi:hypothetical protein QAD02_015311 [Eretmocerus hayati]|uniref:Uncharacterized protein n=1 Tax=Eretmocerus hayati TaxID=131215 RepID=A0ACC2P7H0_9HYME|nr:hypothetical protein QAD02_015311 [Eretmocerus hayati]
MKDGWFDMFRNDAGPTLYTYSNRTPVTGDINLITIFVFFGAIFVAFLLIFPGIRKERLTTFFTVTLLVFVGMTINVAQLGSTWHTSTATIVSSYSVFSRQRMSAEIGGYVGLMHINITYRVLPESADIGDVEFNERFYWRKPHEMTDCFKDALYRGTPFPIISLAEYFSLNEEGFYWGGKYREAGYYASVMLWTSFASWSMTSLLLIMVPRYGAYGMVLTGLFMLFTNFIYWCLLPGDPLVAHVDGSILIFNFGWNYWLLLFAGVACLLAGIVITAIDMIYPHSFSTILEVDYDTPYDRHVIIEDSFDTRRKDAQRKMGRIDDTLSERFSENFMSQVASKLVNGNCGGDSSKSLSYWSYPFPSTPRRIV